MNLANKLTMLRVILIPVFMFFLLTDFAFSPIAALLTFTIASITDALDGYVARSRNMITVFGNFFDTFADKALVSAALICFCGLGVVSTVAVVIIVLREFLVMGLRLIAAEKGVVISAGMPGKLKAAFTMVAIVVILLGRCFNFGGSVADIANIVYQTLIWLAVLITVISGITYFKSCFVYMDYKK